MSVENWFNIIVFYTREFWIAIQKKEADPFIQHGMMSNEKNQVAKEHIVIYYFLHRTINTISPQLSLIDLLTVWPSQISQEHLKLPHSLPIQEIWEYVFFPEDFPCCSALPQSAWVNTVPQAWVLPYQSLIHWYLSSASPNTSFLPDKLPFFFSCQITIEIYFFPKETSWLPEATLQINVNLPTKYSYSVAAS